MKKKLLFHQSFRVIVLLIAVLFAGQVRAAVTFNKPLNTGEYPASGPTITIGSFTGAISACVGTASASPNIQQFTISGSSLTANITATAPTGFEVSLAAGSGYGSSVTLVQSGGAVSSTVVYVRSASTAPAGNISGNVTLTSSGATSQNVMVTGTVNALSTVNSVSNQTVLNGSATTPISFTGAANTFNWVNDTPGIGLAASGTGNIASFTAVNTGSSSVTAHVTVTPQSVGYAYIANFGDSTVSVIKTATNTVVATIKVGLYPAGVSVSPDNSRVYVVCSGLEKVLVINTATNTVIDAVTVGAYPLAVAVSPDGARAYVTNLGSNDVSVINTLTDTVILTIPVSAAPVGVSVSPDGSRVYVANNDTHGTVSVINTSTNSVIATVAVGNGPASTAISPDGGRLYVGNQFSNTVSVINTSTNAVISTIPIGQDPQGISVSPDGSKVYVAVYNSNYLAVINAATNAVALTIGVGNKPVAVSVSPDGSMVYVANSVSNTVSVINTITNSVVATIPVGNDPSAYGNFIANSTGCSGASVTFTITVNPSNNANLANLAINNGTLTPAFSSATTSYTDTVSNATTSVQLTPTTTNALATVKVNGALVASGSASGSIPLTVAPTTIYTVVSAQDGTQRTYTVKVIRRSNNANLANLTVSSGTLSPAFATGTQNYTETVVHATEFFSVTPTTSDANASIKVNGTTVASGTASPGIYLEVGDNYIHAVVTAQDGTVKSYTVVVTRPSNGLSTNANLVNLTISSGTLSPAFVTAATSYTDTVSNATASVMVTPTTSDINATVKVNGTPVTSGTASGSISLAVGNTPIYAVVLAQDGTRRTYTVTVHRRTSGGLNSFYLPGNGEQTPLISSLNQKVEANNILSPNGDGINDIWVVKNIAFYPDNIVTVYDKAGKVVFTKKGYTNDWDGSYRGSALNAGTYYYLVDLGNGNNIKGYITVVRGE